MSNIIRFQTSAFLLSVAIGLTACNTEDALRGVGKNRGEVPISQTVERKIQTKGMAFRAPIMIRIFKEENVLEVWKSKPNGRYALLYDFEICKWSGKLGPKNKEGDKQAPEGFYHVGLHQLNPNSSYHLSFNMGFPNRYDRVHGRTGTHLMIHGDCSSAGCYSMTDPQIEDIYALTRDALRAGQDKVQIQAFPFRMTPENMARHRNNPNFSFWQNIKEGYDHFEITKRPPVVSICDKKYQFNKDFGEKVVRASASCPEFSVNPNLLIAYQKHNQEEAANFSKFVKRFDAADAKAEEEERLATQKAAAEAEKEKLEAETLKQPGTLNPNIKLPKSSPLAESEQVAETAPAPQNENEKPGLFKRFTGKLWR